MKILNSTNDYAISILSLPLLFLFFLIKLSYIGILINNAVVINTHVDQFILSILSIYLDDVYFFISIGIIIKFVLKKIVVNCFIYLCKKKILSLKFNFKIKKYYILFKNMKKVPNLFLSSA